MGAGGSRAQERIVTTKAAPTLPEDSADKNSTLSILKKNASTKGILILRINPSPFIDKYTTRIGKRNLGLQYNENGFILRFTLFSHLTYNADFQITIDKLASTGSTRLHFQLAVYLSDIEDTYLAAFQRSVLKKRLTEEKKAIN